MPQVPSTRWKVSDVMSTVRELTKTVDQKRVLVEQGRYFYKLALSEIVALLNMSTDPSYFTPKELTLDNGVADISEIPYDRIVVIEDATLGQVIPVTPGEFASRLRSGFPHTAYLRDIVWIQYGNKIRFLAGEEVKDKQGTKTMWYQRQPKYPETDGEWNEFYADIADRWVPLLVKRMYTYVVIQNDHDMPKNVYQDMVNDYNQIEGYVQAEFLNLEKDRKQTPPRFRGGQ